MLLDVNQGGGGGRTLLSAHVGSYKTMVGSGNYIIGRYTTAKGTVVRYRSGPIDLFLPHMPGAGLALVKSGIGYHIYFEKHDGPTGTLATVYRLGETAERIFHARVSRWSCSDPTGDYGELHCTYFLPAPETGKPVGAAKVLVLK